MVTVKCVCFLIQWRRPSHHPPSLLSFSISLGLSLLLYQPIYGGVCARLCVCVMSVFFLFFSLANVYFRFILIRASANFSPPSADNGSRQRNVRVGVVNSYAGIVIFSSLSIVFAFFFYFFCPVRSFLWFLFWIVFFFFLAGTRGGARAPVFFPWMELSCRPERNMVRPEFKLVGLNLSIAELQSATQLTFIANGIIISFNCQCQEGRKPSELWQKSESENRRAYEKKKKQKNI